MKYSWIVLSCVMLCACDVTSKRAGDQSSPSTSTVVNGTNKISVLRDINLLPIGDKDVFIGGQDGNDDLEKDVFSISADNASLNEIVSAPMQSVALPAYLERIAYIRDQPNLQAMSAIRKNYQKYRTIWRSGERSVVLARLPSESTGAKSRFERTDLLLLNGDDAISDGLTIYFALVTESSQISQAFYIDANQQIWVKGYQVSEDDVALLYTATFVILPSGKIRKIMSAW